MKKINIFLILIAMLSLLGLGVVILLFGDTKPQTGDYTTLEEYKDNYVTNTGMNKEIIVSVEEDFSQVVRRDEIYTVEFQKSVRRKIDELIYENTYDEDRPLVIYNPFLTNTQSLYVYFETAEEYAVSYSVHTPEAEYEDFGGYVVPSGPDTSKVHEFQVIGLIPGETNMITIRMMDVNGVVKIRRFYYYNENNVEATTLSLEGEQGTKLVENEDKTFSTVPASSESVADGMYVIFPKENELLPHLRIYDNDGVQRCEIPLETFGTRRMIVYEDLMFYRVSPDKIVGVNRLGQVIKVYTAKGYTFGDDFCFDKNNDLLVLASDQSQSSIDDCIILLDRETLTVTELVDLGDLLPEYKVKATKENGVLDWISLNSIDMVEGNRIIVSSDKADVVIKLRRLYNDPRIAFLLGELGEFAGTSYEPLFLRTEGEFEMHDNVNMAMYREYDKIRETRHYIAVLDNNEKYKYERDEEQFAYYSYYLVDEAEGGLTNAGSLRLMDTKVLPAIGADGSMQWYQNHFILASDVTADFYEYDGEFNLITKWHYEEPVVKKTEEQLEYEEDNPPADGTVAFLRVTKQDFSGYYYLADPVLILPAEPEPEETEEIEGAESLNE